jgi:branched-chain amino acid transport system ATP-binding protein
MDEPSEGLAPIAVQALGEHFKALRAAGLSIFLVEQNLHLALDVADDLYILEAGRVAFHGTSADLTANPAIMHRHLGV